MISPEEKEKFLESLEQNTAPEAIKKTPPAPTKKSSATTVFAAGFVFFIFIIILLIFILSLSGSGNPIFQSFGIEPYEIKSFLISIVNNVFMIITILLLLLVAIGIFRGYSLEESSEKKGAFFFAGVAGGLIFLSILAWGGAVAFVNNFTAEAIGKANIEILGFEATEEIIAPVDITFSAKSIIQQYKRQGENVVGIRWSKDDGKIYSPSSLNEEYTFQFFTKGVQKVTLEITLASGKTETYARGFTVDDATFGVTPAKPIQGKSTTFDASALSERGGMFRWDFNNDGIFESSSRSPKSSFIFENKGEYVINLRIEGDNDSVEMYSRKVIISADADKQLDAIINVSPDTKGNTPFEITLDGSESSSQLGQIVEYSWKIPGEKQNKKGTIINYTFQKAGTYDVQLTVKAENNKIDTETITIEVGKGNSPPVAIIQSKPEYSTDKNILEGFLPFEVTFYGNQSKDPEENITDYQWSIISPNGTEEKKYGDSTQYAFREIGTYTVALIVKDKEGEENTKQIQVLVKEPPVVPSVKVFPQSGIAPFIAEFNASESFCRQSGCKILSYEWDFGDGSPVLPSGAIVTHQFTKEGTFVTKMTAITTTGEKATTNTTVTVTKQPLISCFTSSRNEGVAPIKISFDPTCSKGEISEYKWDFGDGYISSSKFPTHSFTEAGSYTVRLHAISKDGTVSEMKTTITITQE